MIDGVIIKELKKYSDERGWLAELFRADELEYHPAMVYASLTNPGVVRGPHEHQGQTDYFVFPGPGDFEVHLWDRRGGSSTEGEHQVIRAGGSAPMTVVVPPGVVHGYKCVSVEAACSINLPDRLYRGAGKTEEVDEIRWETDPGSPYKIN